MTTSLSQPIISNDEKSKWYFLQEGSALGAAVFNNQSFLAGVPLIFAASKGGTVINLEDPDSPGTALATITILNDGDTVEYVPFKNISAFSIYNNNGSGSVVAVSERSDISTTQNPRLLTFTSSGAVSLTGSGYVLAVGGGGGSGGTCEHGPNPGRIATGGSGGTGGFAIGYIADLSTVTSVTIGAAGNTGANAYNSTNSTQAGGSGNAGGTTTLGSVSATGGGGGGGGTAHQFTFTAGTAGAAGSPSGRAGIGGGGLNDRANSAFNAVDPIEYDIISTKFGKIRFANGARPPSAGYNATVSYYGTTVATTHTIGGYSGDFNGYSGVRTQLGHGIGAQGSSWMRGTFYNHAGLPGVVYILAGI